MRIKSTRHETKTVQQLRIGIRAEASGISSTSSSAMDALPKALQAEKAAQGGGSSSSHIYMLSS